MEVIPATRLARPRRWPGVVAWTLWALAMVTCTLAYGLLTLLLGGGLRRGGPGAGAAARPRLRPGGGRRHPGGGGGVPAGPPRIQQAVDRRFNRRRHDAAQMIAAFSGRLRQQVDLDTLSAELLAVLDETMQPTQASLWLRPPHAPSAVVGGVVAQQRS
jgi:hypothetical protein